MYRKLWNRFGCYGIPDIVVSDNGLYLAARFSQSFNVNMSSSRSHHHGSTVKQLKVEQAVGKTTIKKPTTTKKREKKSHYIVMLVFLYYLNSYENKNRISIVKMIIIECFF